MILVLKDGFVVKRVLHFLSTQTKKVGNQCSTLGLSMTVSSVEVKSYRFLKLANWNSNDGTGQKIYLQ